jgi:alkaline phosphatase
MKPLLSLPPFGIAFCLAGGFVQWAHPAAPDSFPAPILSPAQLYEAGAADVRANESEPRHRTRAKNVILFVGDGMGVSTVTAARILAGQLRGASGEENRLSFETLPYLAHSKTYSVNQQTSDSAPTITAMVTGVKTNEGVLSIDHLIPRGTCDVSGHELKTIMEIAEEKGKSTGLVSTARITHATPAANYAHTADRDWESDAAVSETCRSTAIDIAAQLLAFNAGDGPEVVLGGGRGAFLPTTIADPEGGTGARTDGRDLTKEWLARYGDGPGKGAYVWNEAGLDALAADTRHLLGLFEASHMEYEHDRPNDTGGEPSLSEMTATAISLLRQNRKGFYLQVESGRIDHAHHAGNAYRALTDAVEFANAIQVAMNATDPEDTLIIVTADHSHTLTIAGYPKRGNNILGRVIEAGQPDGTYALAADTSRTRRSVTRMGVVSTTACRAKRCTGSHPARAGFTLSLPVPGTPPDSPQPPIRTITRSRSCPRWGKRMAARTSRSTRADRRHTCSGARWNRARSFTSC